MANHSLCSDVAFKARERVVVRILQQEQKLPGALIYTPHLPPTHGALAFEVLILKILPSKTSSKKTAFRHAGLISIGKFVSSCITMHMDLLNVQNLNSRKQIRKHDFISQRESILARDLMRSSSRVLPDIFNHLQDLRLYVLLKTLHLLDA
jgi:hypothetical protein